MNKLYSNENLPHLMYGIYVDYLIDKNKFSLLFSSEFTYESFCEKVKWQVAKIQLNGKTYLILDYDIINHSFIRYTGSSKIVIKQKIEEDAAFDELKAYSIMLGIPMLDQEYYYMTRIPRAFILNE